MSLEEKYRKKINLLEEKVDQLETIVESKSREIFLKDEELLLMALFAKYNPFPVMRIDYDSNICFENPAANQFIVKYKFSRESIKKIFKKNQISLTKIDKSNSPTVIEFSPTQDIIYLICITSIKEANFFNLYFFDISEKKLLEKELYLERMRSTESSKMALLGEMAGGLSHEINTPLGTISICNDQMCSLIEKGHLNEKIAKEILGDLKTATSSIDRIVRSFRFYTRDEEVNEFHYHPISEIISNVVHIFKIKLKNSNINLEIVDEIQSQEELLECNPTLICQVLVNLLKNSYDEVENLESKWIRLTLRKDNNSCLFLIEDSGRGISKEVAEKVFNPFFTTKDIGKGTGIGLSISKEIIENHKGTIEYDNSFEHTCFRVSIPLFQKT